MTPLSKCSDRIGGNGCVRLGVFSRPGGSTVVDGVTYSPLGDSTHDVVSLLTQTLPKLAQYAEEAAEAAGGPPANPGAQAEFVNCSGRFRISH